MIFVAPRPLDRRREGDTLSASESRRASPLGDLPWLGLWLLRVSPWSTGLWAVLILADAAFTALRLWATLGTVNAVTAFVRAAGHAGSPAAWLAVMAAVEAASRVARLCRPLVRERVRIGAGAAIQLAALSKAARVPVEVFDAEATHDLLRRVGEGADTRGPDLIAEVLGLAQQVPSIAVNAIALGLIALWLPFAAAAMEAVFIWQMIAQGARGRRFAVDWTRQRRLTDYYASLLTGRAAAAEVRLWGLRPELLRRWRAGQTEYAAQSHALELRETRQYLPSTVVASGFVVLAVGVLSVTRGHLEPGLAALFLTALFGLMAGMNMIQGAFRQFVGHAGYATDLRAVLEGLPAEAGAAGAPFPRPVRQGIRCLGVSYRYPGASEDALRDIDLDIRPGEVVALVGANGAGKTTLAALLMGLRRPTSGRVEVDGVDLVAIRPADVRRACAAVLQQPVRYPDTVRENVALGRASADGPVRAALDTSGLQDIDDEQLLGPEFGGVDLSGGQWQRLGIARALTRPDAQVLVFDEPTAALDPLAELALFERFATLAAGRTTILISHRLGPTRLADRVFVLDGGRLVESGPPDRLLAAGGLFARMFEAQGAWYR